MVIEQVVTLGNLIVIGIAVVGFVATTIVNISVMSSKTSKFVIMTEMKFAAGEKRFVEHDKDIESLEKRCGMCPQKIKVEELEKEKERMNGEQIKIRSQLPIQLEGIERSIENLKVDLKEDIKNLRDDLALSKNNN